MKCETCGQDMKTTYHLGQKIIFGGWDNMIAPAGSGKAIIIAQDGKSMMTGKVVEVLDTTAITQEDFEKLTDFHSVKVEGIDF